ncbi:SCO family protein [Dyadobacter fanqingshengii]|uniref:SCO family protein n=1 Tax=Dyadobacter fanqingshengii TaxID=2906443 RepID=A0A9X1T982_9BACT|nr:SCO family protein [Dyadobacter fanqingshengii]MCF0039664.1 SCO family protein [Dyadobacter fanqingshengii]USJ38570.1 SCO family protein [Dyadobacter fanqingshengii]
MIQVKNAVHIYTFVLTALISSLISCKNERKLPILGERDAVKKTVDGKEVVDTVYNSIPAFTFVNQEGDTVSEKIVEGKIYVADFFFTTCPTICPIMKRQMVKVYNQYKGNPELMILSHSIDPDHDTPQVLKKFATDLGVQGDQWQFLTGEKEKIYEIGQKHYMTTVKEDKTADGGYLHSGAFVLIDKEKHVRGMYDGTTEEGTQKLIADIKILQEEYKQ